MKKIGLVLGILTILGLLSGFAWADCESDCDGPFQTCLNICRQTTKEDSSEGSKCVNNCFRGLSGCQKRCKANDRKSDNTRESAGIYLLAANDYMAKSHTMALGANCIEQGLTCVLNGTPCCSPYECKGKFPNTTCQ